MTGENADGGGEAGEGSHDHGDVRYLDAKQSVDERAVNRRVRERLLTALPDAPRVFDAGCGTGVALRRLREWGVSPRAYHGVDADPALIAEARDRHSNEGRSSLPGDSDPASTRGDDSTSVSFAVADALAAARRLRDSVGDDATLDGQPDLVVAGSFLDLVSVREALELFTDVTAPGGLVYAPFTFDGTTAFTPSHPADEVVERAYHREIDSTPGRDTRAGRRALSILDGADGDLLAVGSSDWIVRARADGGDRLYPADERYFLDCILGFVTDALFVDPDDATTSALTTTARPAVDAADGVGPSAVRHLLVARRQQLRAGGLGSLPHPLDLLYPAPPES